MNNHAPIIPVDQKAEALAVQSAAAFHSKPVPPREWIVEDLIPSKIVTMLNGDGGTGKSLLALQLAVASVTGGYWCGREVVQGGCLFISAEDDEDELHRRLADITVGIGRQLRDLDTLHLRSLAGEDALFAIQDTRTGVLRPTQLFQMVERRVAQLRPVLLVLDTLADMFGGEENNRAHARQFIGMIRGLCSRYETTVVLLAHPSLSGMASGTGSSGSTAWNNSVRSRLYLDRIRENGEEPDPDVRVLRTKKANYGKIGGEVKLRWTDGMFKLETGADSLVVMAAQSEAERVFLELLAMYKVQGRGVSDKRGSNYAPFEFAREPEAKGIKSKGFESAMLRLFNDAKIRTEEVGPPSRRRRSIVALE
ncbi:AAA family ATPase [Rhizobium mongolense]